MIAMEDPIDSLINTAFILSKTTSGRGNLLERGLLEFAVWVVLSSNHNAVTKAEITALRVLRNALAGQSRSAEFLLRIGFIHSCVASLRSTFSSNIINKLSQVCWQPLEDTSEMRPIYCEVVCQLLSNFSTASDTTGAYLWSVDILGPSGFRDALAAGVQMRSDTAVGATIATLFNCVQSDDDTGRNRLLTLVASRALCCQLLLASMSFSSEGDRGTSKTSEWVLLLIFLIMKRGMLWRLYFVLSSRRVLFPESSSTATHDLTFADIDFVDITSSDFLKFLGRDAFNLEPTYEQLILIKIASSLLDDPSCGRQLREESRFIDHELLLWRGADVELELEAGVVTGGAVSFIDDLLYLLTSQLCAWASCCSPSAAPSEAAGAGRSETQQEKMITASVLHLLGQTVASATAFASPSAITHTLSHTRILDLCSSCVLHFYKNGRASRARDSKTLLQTPSTGDNETASEADEVGLRQSRFQSAITALHSFSHSENIDDNGEDVLLWLLQVFANLSYHCPRKVAEFLFASSDRLSGSPSTSSYSLDDASATTTPLSSPPLIFSLLSYCATDVKRPLRREWALLCMRNLCEGSDAVRASVGALQLQGVDVVNEQLRKQGLQADVDPATGKVRFEFRGTNS